MTFSSYMNELHEPGGTMPSFDRKMMILVVQTVGGGSAMKRSKIGL